MSNTREKPLCIIEKFMPRRHHALKNVTRNTEWTMAALVKWLNKTEK